MNILTYVHTQLGFVSHSSRAIVIPTRETDEPQPERFESVVGGVFDERVP